MRVTVRKASGSCQSELDEVVEVIEDVHCVAQLLQVDGEPALHFYVDNGVREVRLDEFTVTISK